MPVALDPVFYLIGDEVSTARPVTLDSKWKIEDVKRAVGAAFHVAAPLGTCCQSLYMNLR
jgi:hypothetical protein